MSNIQVKKPGVDQSAGRSYEERLKDFGTDLGPFLDGVWKGRKKLFLPDPKKGTDEIYFSLYSSDRERKYDEKALDKFLQGLIKVAGKHTISPQEWEYKERFNDVPVPTLLGISGELWTEFFFIVALDGVKSKARVYVNTPDVTAGLEVMKTIVAEFGKNKGLINAKICGPGCVRPDKIVGYCADQKSADALADVLVQLGTKQPKLFKDELPKIVKPRAKGIGTADEPPQGALSKDGPARHSFGGFYSAICWLALKTTPNQEKSDADGRHFLDNVLMVMRLLEVDLKKPQQFPSLKKIEAALKA